MLLGAVELLQEASFVQFEGSVVEYNRGGSCLFEIDDFLRRNGYFIYDFGDQIMNNARLFKTLGTGQFDVLYIRPASEHLPEYLKKAKPDFCGADRDPFVSHYQQVSSEAIVKSSKAQSVPPNFSLAPLVFGALVGYVIGVARSKRKNSVPILGVE